MLSSESWCEVACIQIAGALSLQSSCNASRMFLEPALNYAWHWTRRRYVFLIGRLRTIDMFCAIILRAVVIQLGATLIKPFEMCMASLWRVRVCREACLKCTSFGLARLIRFLFHLKGPYGLCWPNSVAFSSQPPRHGLSPPAMPKFAAVLTLN